ncbi:MAG: HAMP domain-containing histidine kinase [Candidatus Kuenenia sp.]|nr:HAMP domain-containing histidine kinase [Candidatus Kuenenia hertensis]
MVFGYAIITLLMLSMSFYLIFRLKHLNQASTSVLSSDIPSMENEEKLLKILLEQVSIEKKYSITKDQAFLDIFTAKKSEFINRLNSIKKLITNHETYNIFDKLKSVYTRYFGSPGFEQLHLAEDNMGRNEMISITAQIETLYNFYIGMASKGFILLKYNADDSSYSSSSFGEEKNKTIDQLTNAINKLILLQQTRLFKKMELFQKTVQKSTTISLAIMLFAIMFVAVFSFFFIRSIYNPINALKIATDHVAQGNLDYRISVTSKDEIGSLGKAFNEMCEELEQLDKMKSDFISNISHNLKTPLTSIREANELMLDKIAGQISAEQLKLLNIIKENTLRLILMINDLLDISRIEAGLMRYNFQPSQIQHVISRSIEDIRFLAEKKGISIQYKDDSIIPDVLLDQEKILQVLENLFSNSIKFTPAGGIVTIKAFVVDSVLLSPVLTQESNPNKIQSFVQISVSDTGIGIPEEYHDCIFDKFQQVVNKERSGIKGTGLGLFMAKHIVLDHGGNIWLEKNCGIGSTFHFALPLRVDFDLNT